LKDQDQTQIISDKYAQILAKAVDRGMLSRDFVTTMRFSNLEGGEEEFYNTMAYASWHAYLETGIHQIKFLTTKLEREQREQVELKEGDPAKWDPNYVEEVTELVTKFKQYDNEKPIDDDKNIKIIRNYLKHYNRNLMWGITFLDIHTALLNGRMAKGGNHINKLIDLSKTAVQRDYDIQTAQSKDDRNVIMKLLRLGKNQ